MISFVVSSASHGQMQPSPMDNLISLAAKAKAAIAVTLLEVVHLLARRDTGVMWVALGEPRAVAHVAASPVTVVEAVRFEGLMQGQFVHMRTNVTVTASVRLCVFASVCVCVCLSLCMSGTGRLHRGACRLMRGLMGAHAV